MIKDLFDQVRKDLDSYHENMDKAINNLDKMKESSKEIKEICDGLVGKEENLDKLVL